MTRREDNIRKRKDQILTFREVLYRWLKRKKSEVKVQTYDKYQQIIDRQLIPYLGNIGMEQVTTVYVNQLLSDKIKDGRTDGAGGLSAKYVKTIAFVIGSAIDFAVENKYCPPLVGKINSPRHVKKEITIMSPDEQRKLEDYLFASLSNKKLGILISLYFGLRVGEVCGLRWEDIKEEEKLIHVRHTVERIKNISGKQGEPRTKLTLCEVKSRSSDRLIPIPDKFCKLLKQFRTEKDIYVIPGELYGYTDPRSYQNYFHRCLKEAGLPSINYHALRHTFATRCMESGMDIKTLSELLGHANVTITLNTYVHSSLEHKRHEIEKFLSFMGH